MKKIKLALAVAAASCAFNAMALDVADINGTKIAIGGYFKADGVLNKPDTNAGNGAENSFEGSARQSRINLKISKATDGHSVTGFVEGDFYGNSYSGNSSSNQSSAGSSYFRMRHAFMTIDQVTVGQTWGGQFFGTAPIDTEVLNFWGPSLGTIAGNGGTVRPEMLVHYVNGGMRLTAQDPVNPDAAFPDLFASYTAKAGTVTYAVTGMARDVMQNSTTDAKASTIGMGAQAGAKIEFGKDSLQVSAYTGKGLGAFSGFGVATAADMSTNATAASSGNLQTIDASNGELVGQTGFHVGYKHQFSDVLRGNARYGQVNVDNDADTQFTSANLNLIYTYMPAVELGVEWRTQSMNTMHTPAGGAFPNIRPKGKQLEVMAMYKF
ncbi:hypothetical protein [Parathalassolituus penaei]|uniref:Porin n=1 Tax=Parathalassolituus penaei TaxID=2997323 RepID=A0A9X3ITW6_9GAMM|nr:hypothetical protein [Parathalassolituus penaei]MCY0966324.1 hypothetical protein [Parathalassolituus penaei]